MAKGLKKEATAEEVVAQNGGLGAEATTSTVEDTASVDAVTEEVKGTDVVAEEVVAPAVSTPVASAPVENVQAPVSDAPVVEATAEKTMECLGLKNHTCRIGGNVITVAKDKIQTFTSGVATVLQRAGVVIVK